MRIATLLTIILTTLLFISGGLAQAEVNQAQPPQMGMPTVVDVTAIGLNLEAPDQIASGWTTFNLHNASDMIHFAVINKMPEGVGVEDHQAEVAPVFQEGMDLLNQGETDAAMEAFGGLPAWYNDVVLMGGPGFISPGLTAQTTVFLEPGTYMLECYVKTGGVFHSYNPVEGEFGMVHEFTVTEETTDAVAPEATLELAISSESGIQGDVTGNIAPGYHTVAVTFADQNVYGHFLGHDVQLVRLQDDTDMDALASWMNWTLPDGLESPAPVEFLGGVQDMPAGETGYFSVVLSPGRYAWIAEVPDPEGKGMLHIFNVEPVQ